MTELFVKRRVAAVPGSIPDVLGMFVAEVRFYREIAPVVGVRVPNCFEAEEHDGATLLSLENLSDWRPGGEPVSVARLLRRLHDRWQGGARQRWPWLREPGAASDLIGRHYDATWPTVSRRPECTDRLSAFGERLMSRIPEVERIAALAGPETLVHGDASLRNVRTSPTGEIAVLDWEDVGTGPGVCDLAWLLVSSIDPTDWTETIAASRPVDGLANALPAASSQAILSLADTSPESQEAVGWVRRIDEAMSRLG